MSGFGIGLALFALILGLVGLIKLLAWLDRAVKGFRESAPALMSRAENTTTQHVASALETDTRQTPDRPMMPVPTPDQMLDIFKVMRAAGIKRETISGVWRTAGLPLNNNLWSKAEPPSPPETQAVTPIAGRPTNAKFQDDPELVYHPPPATFASDKRVG